MRERITWTAAVTAVCIPAALMGGMFVGSRDARLAADVERRAAIEECAKVGAVAFRIVETGALICASGSNRLRLMGARK